MADDKPKLDKPTPDKPAPAKEATPKPARPRLSAAARSLWRAITMHKRVSHSSTGGSIETEEQDIPGGIGTLATALAGMASLFLAVVILTMVCQTRRATDAALAAADLTAGTLAEHRRPWVLVTLGPWVSFDTVPGHSRLSSDPDRKVLSVRFAYEVQLVGTAAARHCKLIWNVDSLPGPLCSADRGATAALLDEAWPGSSFPLGPVPVTDTMLLEMPITTWPQQTRAVYIHCSVLLRPVVGDEQYYGEQVYSVFYLYRQRRAPVVRREQWYYGRVVGGSVELESGNE